MESRPSLLVNGGLEAQRRDGSRVTEHGGWITAEEPRSAILRPLELKPLNI
jgi:hypothetical protein